MPPEKVNSSNKSALILVVLLIVVLGVVLLMKKSPQAEIPKTNSDVMTTKEKVDIKEIDVSKVSGEARIPEAFPDDLIVDASAVTKSYVADFSDRGVTQNTLTYTSQKLPSVLYAQYLKYMTDNKYTFVEGGKSAEHNSLYGTKDNDDLSVSISSDGKVSIVNLTYLDRR